VQYATFINPLFAFLDSLMQKKNFAAKQSCIQSVFFGFITGFFGFWPARPLLCHLNAVNSLSVCTAQSPPLKTTNFLQTKKGAFAPSH